MESRAKIFGHAIHPMLIVFPLGLFVAAIVFDILYLINGNEVYAAVSFYNIAGGVIGGLLAAIFGFRDYAAIPGGTRAKRVGIMHGFGNLAVVVLFAFSWLLRYSAPGYEPPVLALLASFGAAGLSLITAWLGGELVERLGVAVDPGANLNAPSSLTSEDTSAVHAGEMAASTSTSVRAVPVTGERHHHEHSMNDIHSATDPTIIRDVDRSQSKPDDTDVIDEP
jgi:uncharacterized membrane protein